MEKREEVIECPSCRQKTRVARVFSVRNHKGIGRDRYDYLHCEKCDALFVSPFPSDDELDRIYARHWQYIPHRSALWASLQSKLHTVVCKSRFSFVARLSSNSGRILDVGCGTGEFLKDMRNAGWDVWGNEISKGAVEQARRNVGENRVYLGSLIDCKFPGSYFDMVTVWHVLEHLRRPSEMLTEIKRVLKPNGVLIVEIPNVKSLSLKLFKESYSLFSYYTPEHLFYWSRRALDTLLKNSGFQLVTTTYPLVNPCPLDFARSFDSFLTERAGVILGRVGFLISAPFSIFNNFLGNLLFGTGDHVRFIVRRAKSNAEKHG